MKTVEIIKLVKGYYVKMSEGASHKMVFCKTKKAAEDLAKSWK